MKYLLNAFLLVVVLCFLGFSLSSNGVFGVLLERKEPTDDTPRLRKRHRLFQRVKSIFSKEKCKMKNILLPWSSRHTSPFSYPKTTWKVFDGSYNSDEESIKNFVQSKTSEEPFQWFAPVIEETLTRNTIYFKTGTSGASDSIQTTNVAKGQVLPNVLSPTFVLQTTAITSKKTVQNFLSGVLEKCKPFMFWIDQSIDQLSFQYVLQKTGKTVDHPIMRMGSLADGMDEDQSVSQMDEKQSVSQMAHTCVVSQFKHSNHEESICHYLTFLRKVLNPTPDSNIKKIIDSLIAMFKYEMCVPHTKNAYSSAMEIPVHHVQIQKFTANMYSVVSISSTETLKFTCYAPDTKLKLLHKYKLIHIWDNDSKLSLPAISKKKLKQDQVLWMKLWNVDSESSTLPYWTVHLEAQKAVGGHLIVFKRESAEQPTEQPTVQPKVQPTEPPKEPQHVGIITNVKYEHGQIVFTTLPFALLEPTDIEELNLGKVRAKLGNKASFSAFSVTVSALSTKSVDSPHPFQTMVTLLEYFKSFLPANEGDSAIKLYFFIVVNTGSLYLRYPVEDGTHVDLLIVDVLNVFESLKHQFKTIQCNEMPKVLAEKLPYAKDEKRLAQLELAYWVTRLLCKENTTPYVVILPTWERKRYNFLYGVLAKGACKATKEDLYLFNTIPGEEKMIAYVVTTRNGVHRAVFTTLFNGTPWHVQCSFIIDTALGKRLGLPFEDYYQANKDKFPAVEPSKPDKNKLKKVKRSKPDKGKLEEVEPYKPMRQRVSLLSNELYVSKCRKTDEKCFYLRKRAASTSQ